MAFNSFDSLNLRIESDQQLLIFPLGRGIPHFVVDHMVPEKLFTAAPVKTFSV